MAENRRRRFGSIRQRASGRYQVRYRGPDGLMRTAPQTFEREKDAAVYLTVIESQIVRGEWADPDRGRVPLGPYAEDWINQRPNLRPRTRVLYHQLLRSHIAPKLGALNLVDVTPAVIRDWRAKMLAAGSSTSVTAKCYRLLRAVMNTAVKEDELIRANPCRIPGADREDAPERPVLSVAQVQKLADLMPPRFKAIVLLTTYGCLRWGEATGLQRQDLDAERGTVWVRRAMGESETGRLQLGPVKSRAGVRRVSLPVAILPDLREHLRQYVGEAPDALVFTGPSAAHPPLRRNNFRKLVDWADAVAEIGVPDLHFHDLRHTGNTLAASTGASLRDLMARMGHDSTRAALIYQHASSDADKAIAEALDRLVGGPREEKGKSKQKKRRKRTTRHPEGRDLPAPAADDGDDGSAGVLVSVG